MKIQNPRINTFNFPKPEISKNISDKFSQVKKVVSNTFPHMDRTFVTDYVKQNKLLFSATALSSLLATYSIYTLTQNNESNHEFCDDINVIKTNAFLGFTDDQKITDDSSFRIRELVSLLFFEAALGVSAFIYFSKR